MSLILASSFSIPIVLSSHLEELVAGLTAFFDRWPNYWLAHMRHSHHTVQSDPPTRFLHGTLSCHFQALPATLSSISHPFPFTSSLAHPSPISDLFLSILSPVHPTLFPLLPLGLDEGVKFGSNQWETELSQLECVAVCLCFGENVSLQFLPTKAS